MRTLSLLVLGAFLGSCSDLEELETRCHESAKIIVHDPQLWAEYQIGAQQTYRERAEGYPQTGKVVAEYVAGFEQRFGNSRRDSPEVVPGQVTREDLWITKSGKPVAQYVNFYLGGGWPGYGGSACIGLYPALYSDQE